MRRIAQDDQSGKAGRRRVVHQLFAEDGVAADRGTVEAQGSHRWRPRSEDGGLPVLPYLRRSHLLGRSHDAGNGDHR